MPNPNTIQWFHYQDIQISDVTLSQQFQQYVAAGNYIDALSLLTNNEEQLAGKAYIANVINTITSGILDLESRFKNGVTLFLSNLAIQYNTLIANMKKIGTWLITAQYMPYNFVIYNQEIYMCIQQPPVGTLPTNTTYWLYLGLRGEQGAPGVDVTMRYDWNATTAYNPNDLVVYGTNIYVALTANTGVTPGTSSATWLLFLVSTPGQIFVGTTAPQYPTDNTIWFETASDPLAATTTDPIYGQFQRYVANTSTWEDMYPNVLFTWVDGLSNYAPEAVYYDITIEPTSWVNNQYILNYTGLDTNSFVLVLPVSTMTPEQYSLYSQLTLEITGTDIVLTTPSTPTVSLPIIIKIQ